MKARNPSTGNLEEVYVKALDSLPVGTEVDFDGQASDIPAGWEQVDNVLWTNPSPTSDFSAQNIVVDLSNYDAYEIIYYSSKGDQLVHTTGIIPKMGNGTKLFMAFNASGNSFITSRQVDLISTGLSFYDAYYYQFTSSTEGTANNRLIPLYILGYKTGLF